MDCNFVLTNACWFRDSLVALLTCATWGKGIWLCGQAGWSCCTSHCRVWAFLLPSGHCPRTAGQAIPFQCCHTLPSGAVGYREKVALSPLFSPGPPRLWDSGHPQYCSIPGTSSSISLFLCTPLLILADASGAAFALVHQPEPIIRAPSGTPLMLRHWRMRAGGMVVCFP